MNLISITIVCCRLIAIYWILKFVRQIAEFVDLVFYSPYEVQGFNLQSGSAILINVLFACLFWFGAKRISKFITPDDPDLLPSQKFNNQDFQTALFAAVGLFTLISTIPELIGLYYNDIFLNAALKAAVTDGIDVVRTANYRSSVIKLSIKICLGIILLFGAKGISGALIYIRKLGTKLN